MNTFPTLAGFNQWANTHIYTSVAELSDDDYRKDCGAFFGSIHVTLNHLLLVDRLWTGRIKGTPFAVNGLDDILYDNFADLQHARGAEDAALIELVDSLSEDDLTTPVTYRTTEGTEHASPPWVIFTTLFNHQTHHRGQVHTLLTQSGITPPDLDVIYYTREIGVG